MSDYSFMKSGFNNVNNNASRKINSDVYFVVNSYPNYSKNFLIDYY